MEYIVLALTIFGILALIMLNGWYGERKKKARFVEWLRENYGVLPEREEYKPEEMEKISRYFREHKAEGFHIDDITWNDLSMDKVFQQMNHTYSAAGEEYLYYLLRTPMQDTGNMEAMEQQIQYFSANRDKRVEYQIRFAQIGKTGKYSIYDYLHYLDLLGERSSAKHYLGDLAIAAALLLMFASVQAGVLAFTAAMSYNIVSYFKTKNEIDPYITSFSYILRLLKNAEEIEKLPVPVLARELEELGGYRKKMGKFKTGSYILMSPARMGASGNPLEILMDYVRMVFHVDLIKFNSMLAEVRKNSEGIDRMITLLGYIEAVIAIGCYRASKETWCLPCFHAGKELLIEDGYHPIIENPVKNSIMTKRGVLLTGSNASGKSTFLKTVAINAILAQTVHTCLAEKYSGGLYRILSSMALRDDLAGGESYYIVEIKSLKRILDQPSDGGNPVLCFVDEVLRGTNTVERIAASTQILKSLAGRNVLCFAATHDIELTHLLEMYYNNYHFEEEVDGDDVVFGYQLKKGRAGSRNAIRLLGVMGYEEDIIEEAERLAEHFLESGTWLA